MSLIEERSVDQHQATGWRALESRAAVADAIHRRPFRVEHDLHKNPLFSLESLLELAREIQHRPEDVYFDAGKVEINDKWGQIPIPQLPLTEVVRRVETAGAWIIMKHVEKNKAYADVLNEFARFVWDQVGPEKAKLLTKPEMLIIITSPKRLTSFHFDAEPNFLIQVSGSKEAWVCDPADRSIVSEQEIERYYGCSDTGTYKPDAEQKASHFTLQPGEGVHIPTHGAHWVRNGDNISISLSLNFEFPSWVYKDIYQANYYLRKLGLNPRPKGVSPTLDSVKATGMRSLAKTVRSARGVVSALKPARAG